MQSSKAADEVRRVSLHSRGGRWSPASLFALTRWQVMFGEKKEEQEEEEVEEEEEEDGRSDKI